VDNERSYYTQPGENVKGYFACINGSWYIKLLKLKYVTHTIRFLSFEEGFIMKRSFFVWTIFALFLLIVSCSPSYQVKPVSFKSPDSFDNAVSVDGAQIGAKAFVNAEEAKEAFGFDVRKAGMLPVQVVFDNQGDNQFEINGDQTFLEDETGNLWPILSNNIAYERATKYAETSDMVKEGAYKGALGAAAGAIIGAAIGIVTNEGVGAAAGKGAAVGAAAGATLGGAGAYGSGDARRDIIQDLQEKSLQNTLIKPKSIAYGILFFPGEAKSAKKLRLQLVEENTQKVHVLNFNLSQG
jgi:hypothetical protein